MSAKKESSNPIGIVFVAAALYGLAMVLAGVYQQFRQFDVTLTAESVNVGTDDDGNTVASLIARDLGPDGLPLGQVRWDAPVATLPAVSTTAAVRLQDIGPDDMLSRAMLWGGNRTYRVVAPDEGLRGRLFSSAATEAATITASVTALFATMVVYMSLTYRRVRPREGVYTFNKPFASELFLVVLYASVLVAGIAYTVFLWMSHAPWYVLLFDFILTIPFVFRWGYVALREARNVRDHMEVGPEWVHILDNGEERRFLRADVLHVHAEASKNADHDNHETSLIFTWQAHLQREPLKLRLDDLNLAGFAGQITALFPKRPEQDATMTSAVGTTTPADARRDPEALADDARMPGA